MNCSCISYSVQQSLAEGDGVGMAGTQNSAGLAEVLSLFIFTNRMQCTGTGEPVSTTEDGVVLFSSHHFPFRKRLHHQLQRSSYSMLTKPPTAPPSHSFLGDKDTAMRWRDGHLAQSILTTFVKRRILRLRAVSPMAPHCL